MNICIELISESKNTLVDEFYKDSLLESLYIISLDLELFSIMVKFYNHSKYIQLLSLHFSDVVTKLL
jgi:hypothetical protein